MRRITKGLVLFECFAISLLFCSCSTGNAMLEDQLAKRSDIQSDEAWLMYENLLQTGGLDEEGYYNQPEASSSQAVEAQPTGTIHVTFARNSYLNVVYALDAEKTNLVISTECYLEPGDSLYLASLEVDNPYSNQYRASGFKVYAYKDTGERELLLTVPIDAEAVLAIPEGFDKTELSIEPVGEYEDRTLALSDYCFKEDGTQENLNGTWSVEAEDNETGHKSPQTNGDSLTVSPVIQYHLQYNYADYINEYYFEKSTPDCIYFNDDEGTVQFEKVSSQDTTERYSVQLHRYITIEMTNNVAGFLPFLTSGKAIQEIQINGVIWEDLDKDKKEQSIPHLKCGDKLILKVDPQCSVSCEELETEMIERDGMREYALLIPQTYLTELHLTASKE